jgi:hypothetical protein
MLNELKNWVSEDSDWDTVDSLKTAGKSVI